MFILFFFVDLVSFRVRMDSVNDVIVKLQKLNCPFVGDDVKTHWWIEEMIFQPGKSRIEFLKWIFVSLGINRRLVSNVDLESETKSLTKVAVTSGLCLSTEENLITGLATKKRQSAFISYLLDLLVFQSKRKSNEPDSTLFDLTIPYLDVTCTAAKSNESFEVTPNLRTVWNCMTKIVADGHFSKSIDAKMTVKLPIGLQKELERTKSECDVDLPNVTSLKDEVHMLRMTLNELPNKMAVTEDQNLRSDELMKKLEAASSNFIKLYDNELRFWCRAVAPKLSSLGTYCKNIEPNLVKLIQVTKNIDRLRRFHLEEIPKFKAQVSDIEERLNLAMTTSGIDGFDLCLLLDTFATVVEKWTAFVRCGGRNSDIVDKLGLNPS